MDNAALTALRRALVHLINHEDYPVLKHDIEILATTTHGTLAGDLAYLNPLVDFARGDQRDSITSLWALADQKARELRWEVPTAMPPDGQPKPGLNQDRKRHDSAVLMKARRQRWTKAAKLWFRLTGERLIGANMARRREFETEMQATWMLWRDGLLTPDLSGEEKLEIIRAFWDDIEDQLDQALAGNEVIGRRVLGLPPKGDP